MITMVTTTDKLTGAELTMYLSLPELVKLLQHWQADYTTSIEEVIRNKDTFYTFIADNGDEYTIYIDYSRTEEP